MSKTSIATLGAGCYWCVEAVLIQVPGVLSMYPGFMGGQVDDPTYEAVCSGTTGHTEVLEIEFDPDAISFRQLLGWFWRLHDPTTLNAQGADVGTQYRSAIYYHDEAQREDAAESKRLADASGHFTNPIVTEITAASTFYKAKQEHQDYYRRNSDQGYCRMVIRPKLQKLGLEY
jgi:peptide-methionine (S)-S-oxide reductase